MDHHEKIGKVKVFTMLIICMLREKSFRKFGVYTLYFVSDKFITTDISGIV